jgi:leader peptidase (prepilin peptidase)/N-methyltransferase
MRISARYPLVEALGSAVALVAWHRHGLTPAAASELAFVATLVALAFIDLDTWLLPNVITWPLIASGLTTAALGLAPARSLRLAAFGAGLGFGVFALLSWLGEKAFKKEALGFGDVWLLAGLGAWMGPAALLPIALLASLQGCVVGIGLILVGKGQKGPPNAPEPQHSPPAGESATEGVNGGREGEELRTTTESTITHTTATDEGEDDWVPPKHAVPFGPFLVAGALEWLWLGGFLTHAIPVLRLFR